MEKINSVKKNWWLKLPENFYERDEIKMIEALPNGSEYINFYFKILLKSLSNDGKLLFKETIPYSPEMLSSITGTPIATVTYAINLFKQLGLIDIIDGDTFYMSELEKMVGSETQWAAKKREYREKKESLGQVEDRSKTKKGQCPIRDKRLELREETTTDLESKNEKSDEIQKAKEAEKERQKISSNIYDFLDLKEFDKVDEPTKENLRKLSGLNYTNFKIIYNFVVIEEKKGKVKNFNAYLFKAIKDNWNIKSEVEKNTERVEVRDITDRVIDEKKVHYWSIEKTKEVFLERTKKYPEMLVRLYFEKLEEYITREE